MESQATIANGTVSISKVDLSYEESYELVLSSFTSLAENALERKGIYFAFDKKFIWANVEKIGSQYQALLKAKITDPYIIQNFSKGK